MKIGALVLDNQFVLAPLAGYTDLAFRLLCREYGAALCCSEMISCHGLVYQQQNTLAITKTTAVERPVAMQLFGSDPEIMGEAAAILSAAPIDLIDINMGCPARKVVRKGGGAALMKESNKARLVIREVVRKSQVPVTVKIRSGWDHNTIVAVDFAQMAEDEGVSAVTVHARTCSDGFGGRVDWQVIARVKQAVTIAVIGNGDIKNRQDGLKMMARTNCDAVMIGRAALGTPWVFQDNMVSSPSLAYRLTALRRYLQLINLYYEPDKIMARIKNHAGRYLKGLADGRVIRKKIYEASNFDELCKVIDS